MNVTLGVPRIKEIINAARNISTPIITVRTYIPALPDSNALILGDVPNVGLMNIKLFKFLSPILHNNIANCMPYCGCIAIRSLQ